MAFEQYSLGDAVCATMHTLYPQIVMQDRKRDGMLIVQCQGCARRYLVAKATVVPGANIKLPFNHGVITVNVERKLSTEQEKAAETVCKIEGHDLGAPAPKGFCNRCGKQVDYDILSGLEKARVAADKEAMQSVNVGLGPLNSDIRERLAETAAVATATLKLEKTHTPPEIIKAIKEEKTLSLAVDFDKTRATIGEVIKEGPWAGFEVISTYSSNEAVEDGILFDLDLLVIAQTKGRVHGSPLKYVTTSLLEKGYWNDRCNNAVPIAEAGKNDRCKSCPTWIVFANSGPKTLPCTERTLNIPNVIDLITQALKIFTTKPADDTFVSGRIELPDGSKQKIFIAQNETGRYTVMLPEDY